MNPASGAPHRPEAAPLSPSFGRPFVTASAITLSAQTAVAVLGYAFQATMGRLLGPSDFAAGQALFAAFTIASVPAAPMLLLFSKRIGALVDAGDFPELRRAIARASLMAGGLGATCVAGALGFPDVAARLFPGTPASAILAAAAAVPVNLVGLVGLHALLGQRRLAAFNGVTVLVAGVKLLAAATLLGAGLGVVGMTGGLFVSSVCYAALAVWLACRARRSELRAVAAPSEPALPRGEILAAIVANLGFALATQVDLIYVSRHLPRAAADGYAGVAAFAKLIFQLPGTIAFALFPLVSGGGVSEAESRAILQRALGLVAALVVGGLGAYALAPGWLLGIAFGETYVGVAGLLLPSAAAAAPYAFVHVLLFFAVGRGRALLPWMMGIQAVGVSAYLFSLHPGVEEMLLVLGSSGAAMTLVGVLTYARSRSAAPPAPPTAAARC